MSDGDLESNKLLSRLRRSWDDMMTIKLEPSANTCASWLLGAVSSYNRTILVLDGLDALKPRALRDLMSTLKYLFVRCPNQLKVLLSSRNGTDISPFDTSVPYRIALRHWDPDEGYPTRDRYSDLEKVLEGEWPDLASFNPELWTDIVRLSEGSYVVSLKGIVCYDLVLTRR